MTPAICLVCRAIYASMAYAALDVLADPDATDDERTIAAEEITETLLWLRLPSTHQLREAQDP